MLTILCLDKQYSELTHVYVLTRCDLYPAFKRYLSTLYTQVASRQSLSGPLFYGSHASVLAMLQRYPISFVPDP